MTGYTSWRLPVYAALGAVGLVAGLALGRVEPVALAAPFLLALVAAVAEQEPEVSVRASLDRDRVIEGDEVTATIELFSARGADRLELLVQIPRELSVEGETARAVRLRPDEERTVELKLRCDHWGVFSVGQVLFRARDTLGFRSRRRSSPATRARGPAARGSSSPTCANGSRGTGCGASTGARRRFAARCG